MHDPRRLLMAISMGSDNEIVSGANESTSASRGKSGITYDQTTFPTGAYNGLHFVLRSPGVNCNAL